MWSSRTPQRALQQTPRTEFRAPEHPEELSSSLQGPSFEFPNTSRSSQAASQDRIPSSRTSRGAVKQPPRNEFRAPKQASQEESKQSKGKQASKQPSKQASNQTSKRANEQASKRASKHTTKRTNKQASKQASKRSAGCPEGLAIIIRLRLIPPTSGHGGLDQLLSKYINIRDAHARLPGASPGAGPEHFWSRSWGSRGFLGSSKTLTCTAFRAHGAFLTTP